VHCYTHPAADAIGICRACSRGLCAQCVVDLGHSISCQGQCEKKAEILHSMIAQHEVIIRTSRRNRFFGPAFFTLLGGVFLYFNLDAGDLWNFGSIAGLCFMLFGVILFILGQRYAKDIKTDA